MCAPDFLTNFIQIIQAFDDVCLGLSDINWAALTYIKTSNTIFVERKSSGTMSELCEFLDENGVYFIFISFHKTFKINPVTFINWIGDKVPIKEKIDKAFHHLELISYLYKVDKVLTIGKTEFLKMDIFSKISVNFKEFPDFLTPISLSDRIKFTSDESYTIQNWKRQSSEVEKQDDCSYDEVYDVETKK